MRTHQMICRSIGGPLTATVYYCSRRLMNESRGSARQVSSRILTQTKGIRSGTNPAWIFHSTVEGQRTLDLEHAQIFWKWLVDDVDGGYSAVISQGFKKKIGPSPSKKVSLGHDRNPKRLVQFTWDDPSSWSRPQQWLSNGFSMASWLHRSPISHWMSCGQACLAKVVINAGATDSMEVTYWMFTFTASCSRSICFGPRSTGWSEITNIHSILILMLILIRILILFYIMLYYIYIILHYVIYIHYIILYYIKLYYIILYYIILYYYITSHCITL